MTKISFLFILFLSGLFVIPILGGQTMTSRDALLANQQGEIAQTSYIPKTIRIAIYDEPDLSSPTYDTSGGTNHNNVTYLQSVLTGYGYQVTLLDQNDIYDHQLKTADYDVFILADNNPRVNISGFVKEYWRGGGSILAFDGAGVFLCYFGILPPEAAGTDGNPPYWTYSSSDIVINERHPVSKSYAIDDSFITADGYNYLAWDFAVLQASSIGDDLIKVASTVGDSNRATILAFDPSNRGGRVVTVSFDLVHGSVPALNQLYADSVEWLAPSPKGRILFDYTHQPYYGIDAGDPAITSGAQYSELRDIWVNHTFTVDKLYPNDVDEISSVLLAKYDLLMINTPNMNFTASEISAIQSWISSGGGLLILGEWGSFSDDNARINEILSPYYMSISTTYYVTIITSNSTFHPINEDLSFIHFDGGAYINVEDDAVPIWMDNGGYLAGIQEVGDGRIFLAADINGLSNYIGDNDNAQFGLNIANWLCSGGADILLYTDGKVSLGVNYNFYKSPAALALNELGVNYFMTNERDYFNESLKLQTWNLLIIDSNNYAPATSHSMIRDHIESGGRVVWRDFMFRQAAYDSMWNFLGWKGLENTIQAGPPTVFQWDAGHPVFNMPVDYGANNFTSSHNLFSTDYANVTVLDNGTAIAGTSLTTNENASAIIMSHGGRVLCNMFAISEYLDDTDDSTYADGFELFLNEIAYMLQPSVNHPVDIEYTQGETGNSIVWVGHSELPSSYVIKMDTSPVHSANWNGGTVSYNVDGLTNGTYVFSITLNDAAGYFVSDTVTVTVLPAATNTTTTTGTPLDPMIIIIIIAAAGAVIVIIAIFLKKRPST